MQAANVVGCVEISVDCGLAGRARQKLVFIHVVQLRLHLLVGCELQQSRLICCRGRVISGIPPSLHGIILLFLSGLRKLRKFPDVFTDPIPADNLESVQVLGHGLEPSLQVFLVSLSGKFVLDQGSRMPSGKGCP